MSSNNWVLDCGCSILMLLRLLFLRHGIHSCLLQFNVGEGQMLVLCQLTWEVVARELRTAEAQFELITSLLLASDHGQLKEDQTRLPASQYTFYLKLEVGSNPFMIHPHSVQILALSFAELNPIPHSQWRETNIYMFSAPSLLNVPTIAIQCYTVDPCRSSCGTAMCHIFSVSDIT